MYNQGLQAWQTEHNIIIATQIYRLNYSAITSGDRKWKKAWGGVRLKRENLQEK